MGIQYPRRVARKAMYYIFAFSVFIGILATVIQVYIEYKSEVAELEDDFSGAKRVVDGAIAQALWVRDIKQLDILVDSIAGNHNFSMTTIRENGQVLAVAGQPTDPAAAIVRTYPVNFLYRGGQVRVGEVAIHADMNGIYQRLFVQAQKILLWNIVQTLVVAVFIFFIFFQLVTKHIHGIAAYLEELDPHDMGVPMRLERAPTLPDQRDELDMLVSAFNDLRDRLFRSQEAVKKSREEVEGSERRYRAILDDMLDTYYRTDIDGLVTMASPSGERLLGWPIDEVIGRPLADFYAEPDGRDKFLAAFKQSGGMVHGFESLLRHKNGGTVWVSTSARMMRDENNNYIGVEGIARDITAQREAAEAVRDSERQLRLVADSLPATMFFIDKDLKVRFANKLGAKWYTRTPDEMIGGDISQLLPAKVVDEVWSRWEAVLKGKAQHFEVTFTYTDGLTRTMEMHYVPHVLNDGGVAGFFALGIEITQKKALEDRLRQSQKMEALGQLTGGVAHDFNNLLGVILGNVELLQEEPDMDRDERGELLDAILRVGGRGAGLTRQLLAFSRQQPLMQEPTRLDVELTEFAELLRRTLGEGVKLSIRHDPSLWPCMVDRALLENALLNLALNARDAMRDGGRLTIVASNIGVSDPSVAVDLDLEPGDYVCVSVSDNGVGMPAEVIAHAFEPFFTTKDVGAGTGLGLSMVYGFARQSGGGVFLSSEDGEGTTVALYLPRLVDTVAVITDLEKRFLDEPGGAEKVLIVEDDPDMRRITTETLQRFGYAVTVAGDGPEAIGILEDNSEFDLVLTDIRLPNGMLGLDVARQAQQMIPSVAVVYMTGYADASLLQSDGLGEDAILLRKPFRRTDLAQALKQALHAADT